MPVTVGFPTKMSQLSMKYCRVQLILVSVSGRLFDSVTNVTCTSKTVCREA